MVDYGETQGKKQATPSGTRSMTPTEKEVVTTAAMALIPLGTGVAAARLLAREGLKAVTKKFGKKTAEAVSENKNKFKPVLDPTSKASKELITTGRFLNPKTGRFLTRSEAKLVQDSAKKGTATKIRGVSTLRALNTAVSMDKPEKTSEDSRTARLEPLPEAKEVKQRPEPKQAPKPRPKAELVEREGPSYSDDMTPPKRFSEQSGRKFIRDILGDDTKVEYEDMSEAGPDGARKGGMRKKAAPKSKYGMKAGGFTKRGGMYKKGMS